MCPSYMVTREEKHSTRGRARMLFEMMNGEVIDDGWKSDEVKDALDLCLSCKGCKGECPVNVDMATYKAEFLSHYYEGRLRPRHAYAFGWIHIWSRTRVGRAVGGQPLHAITRAWRDCAIYGRSASEAEDSRVCPPVVQDLVPVACTEESARAAGRSLRRHFQQLFSARCGDRRHRGARRRRLSGERAHGGICAAAGHFTIMVFSGWPSAGGSTCSTGCGRIISVGVPMVVLEPSCWAAFHDELSICLPNNEDAKRLKDSDLYAERFSAEACAGLPAPS